MSAADAFASPGAWPALVGAAIVLALLVVAGRRRARRIAAFLGPRADRIVPGVTRRTGVSAALLAGIGLLLAAVALLGPRWGESTRRIERRGVDVVVCLDVSQSMLARDVPPNRLAAAQREIRDLASRSAGDRFALVVFAGEARLAVPLTRDADTFAALAERAGTLDVLRGGTDLGAALDAALAAVDAGDAGGAGASETVVLLTDGEDHEARGLRAADRVRQRGVAVHCVGMGTAAGGKIPVAGPRGETFLRDAEGREVVTSLDPQSLRRVAEATGGTYRDGGAAPGALAALYDERIAPMARRAYEAEERRERVNRFRWPLLAAFGLWILHLCLADRLRR